MASKRKISYQLKLFIPIVGMLWLIIIGFSYLQIIRERAYRTNYINSRIDLINKRVLDLCEQGDDPSHYMNFIDQYFDNSVFGNLSMAIYSTGNGEVVAKIGFDAPYPAELRNKSGTFRGDYLISHIGDKGEGIDPERAFYYNIAVTSDGKRLVQTILPDSAAVEAEVSGGSWWWMFIIISCVVVMVITYFITRHLAQNVKLLRDFAMNASSDREFVTIDKFSSDELGEISRQIVNIYNMRKAALASREIEHEVALKATEERNLMRRQLTNNINHELKTPASIIKGYIDTILDNPDMDDEDKLHFINKSKVQIERLCSILNDISTMTRLEEGSTKIQLVDINFREFVANLAQEVRESGIIGEMTFSYNIPEDCHVKGNNTLLTSALMNLVKNAVAYSRGTRMGIRYLTRNNRFYTFVFYDNGIGVGEEHLPRLFERFYRVDKGRSRKEGGTGLGLPIVRSSLNTMGGSISVRNASDGGLEFIFTLSVWNS